ncbi:MAG: hypothetical protein U0359_07835 [Byssovorax sp.]
MIALPPAAPPPASPYRILAEVDDLPAEPDRAPFDPALAGMALFFIVASVLRAAPALLGREAFGAEPTLALLAALLVAHQLGQAVYARFLR